MRRFGVFLAVIAVVCATGWAAALSEQSPAGDSPSTTGADASAAADANAKADTESAVPVATGESDVAVTVSGTIQLVLP